MTNEQILKKAIKKAVKNGWKDKLKVIKANPHPYAVIFSHNFAKTFVKYLLTDEFLTKPYAVGKVKRLGFDAGQKKENNIETMKNNFLQQMVLEKEPIKYLEKFLDER